MKLKDAFQLGNAGQIVAWSQKEAGWVLYNITEEPPEEVTPDFIIIKKGNLPLKKGNLPLPLHDAAAKALYTLIKSEKEKKSCGN